MNEISKGLNIKMSTVTSMMKKLAMKKLVHYESYKPLRLTEKGKKEAGLIIRKHRLSELFLVEKMRFGWEYVHDIAEQIEHIQSSELFERMGNGVRMDSEFSSCTSCPSMFNFVVRETTRKEQFPC